MASRFDFVSIGAYTKDTIVTRPERATSTAAATAIPRMPRASPAISVGAVTRLAAEDRKSTDLLRSAGVEVDRARVASTRR